MLRGVYEKTHDPEPDLDNANVGMLTEHIGLMWPRSDTYIKIKAVSKRALSFNMKS